MPIKNGDKIKVEYTGTLDDGTVFDSSKHGDHSHPLEFEVGKKQVIPGFEKQVLGMKKDEEKTFRLESKDAYGDHNPQLIKKIPRDKLPKEVKAGMMIGVQLPQGGQIPVQVVEVNDKEVTLDLNHPLAGKALNFQIKIVDIINNPSMEGVETIELKESKEEIEKRENNEPVTEKRL